MISTKENFGGTASRAITELEPLCAAYDGECVKLEELIAALETDLEAVKANHLKGLKRQANVVAAREAELHNAVEASPELFRKPRTFVMHGCKVGYATSTGKVAYEDEGHVVALIERHFKDRFDDLVKTERTPRKDALRALTAVELARVGCRLDDAGDVVLVKRESGDMDKLIKKLIEKLVDAMVQERPA